MRKILLFHHNTSSVGAGLSLLHIVQSIEKAQYEVVVCIPEWKGDLKEKIQNRGIRVRTDFCVPYEYTHVNGYNYSLFSVSHFHNIYNLLCNKAVVEKILQEEQPDIIMVNSMTLFWIGRLAQKKGVKTVCFNRETYCRGLFGIRTRYMKHRLNTSFDKIVFLSDYDMQQTGNCYDKYIKITDKVDVALYENINQIDARKELGLPSKEKLILFAGGISKLKGIEVILKALNSLQTEAKLVVLQYSESAPLGSGLRGLRQRIQRLQKKDTNYWAEQYIAEHQLKDKLILRGSTDEVEKYFVACDLVVFPSREAHQARPIFEAGVAKRPIIISDFENTREFLDETNGWCVKYDDAEAWAKVCDEVLVGGPQVVQKVKKNYNDVIRENNLKTQAREIKEALLRR